MAWYLPLVAAGANLLGGAVGDWLGLGGGGGEQKRPNIPTAPMMFSPPMQAAQTQRTPQAPAPPPAASRGRPGYGLGQGLSSASQAVMNKYLGM